MKNILFVLLFSTMSLCFSQQKTKIPKEAYQLSMSSYQEIYGKNAENEALIKYFGKKRQKSFLYTSLGSGLASSYFFLPNSPVNIITLPALVVSVPIFSVGLGLGFTYNRKRLYRYLIHETPIPEKISKKLTTH